MSNQELKNLEKNIQRLKAQLAGKRDTLVTIAPEDKVRIQQQMEDLQGQIQGFEREKWQLIAKLTEEMPITNEEAEPIVTKLITEIAEVAIQPSDQNPTEILELLRQILAKLNEPNTSASAKLKTAISTIPPFISLTYEVESDAETAFQRYLPSVNRWVEAVKNRLKK